MSISIDDLVASLSSNHIGQEAIDLATLQAQLAQSLFSQPFPSSANNGQTIPQVRNCAYAPCNTPTVRTPSSSLSRGNIGDHIARRRSRTTSRAAIDQAVREKDETMEEDERMVEDILMPPSPMSTATPQSQFPFSNQQAQSMSRSSTNPYTSPPVSSPSPFSPPSDSPTPTSTFASTDPFYMAQLQASNSPPQSFFAQAGRPSHHSPFLPQYPSHRHHRRDNHNHPLLHVDTHSVMAVNFEQ